MSVDTKGVIVTPFKDVFPVVHVVRSTLEQLLALGAKAEFPDATGLRRFSEEVRERFSSVTVQIPHSNSVQFLFTFAGERRQLTLNFDCDCDNVKFGPKSLSMSLGCWGSSVPLMTAVLCSLSFLGDAYLLECDTNDDYKPVHPLSAAELVVRRLMQPWTFLAFGRALAAQGLSQEAWAKQMGVPFDEFSTTADYAAGKALAKKHVLLPTTEAERLANLPYEEDLLTRVRTSAEKAEQA